MSDRYCPLKFINHGFIPGNGQDARSHNKILECRTDCAWFQHESCAIANAAGSLWAIVLLLERLAHFVNIIATAIREIVAVFKPQAEEVGDDGQALGE